MSEIEILLERFRRGPELLASVLTGAAGPELDFQPAPEKWTVRQLVAHVSDSDLVACDRFRRIVAEDNPVLIGFDQNLWAQNLDYSRRKTSQALETFRRLRAEMYDILKDLPAETYDRTGSHNERGTITLLDLLRIMAEHAEEHTKQIRAVRDQYKASRAAKA